MSGTGIKSVSGLPPSFQRVADRGFSLNTKPKRKKPFGEGGQVGSKGNRPAASLSKPTQRRNAGNLEELQNVQSQRRTDTLG